jgi:hypothetical protein
VTFDLIGLPPTPGEIADFLADQSPDAFGKVVERLLASPRYGERWARHWLDVVRYTDSLDTRGFGGQGDVAEAWRYRDWVASAFNQDLPYDQFVTQQIAGDLIEEQPGASFDPAKIVATGMYAIGNWGTGDADKEKVYTDIVDDQIDVTGRAFLGLTLACARCHDHKFDPIPTADYYGLAGIFFSSRILDKFAAKTAGENPMRIPLLSPDESAKRDAAKKRLPEIDAQLAQVLRPLTEESRNGAGNAGLIGWRLPGADNPSLTINTSDHDVSRGTANFPARSAVLHPGPHSAVSAVWRSPEAGPVRISARVSDADPHCGDGIEWAICQSGKTLASGVLEKGKSAAVVDEQAVVAKDELLALVVRPRANYSCDSTRVEWSVRTQDGTVWDLPEALLKEGGRNLGDAWAICAGEGTRFADSAPEFAPLVAERQSLVGSAQAPSRMPRSPRGRHPADRLRGIPRRAHSCPRPL